MRSNLIRHKILKVLNKHYQDGENKSGFGIHVTDLGRSLSNIDIHKETGLSLKIVDDICFVLASSKHIQIIQEDESNKSYRCLITSWGRETVINDYFISQDKKTVWALVKDILLLVAALGSFAFAIYTSIKNNKNEKEIQSLKDQVERLNKKVFP